MFLDDFTAHYRDVTRELRDGAPLPDYLKTLRDRMIEGGLDPESAANRIIDSLHGPDALRLVLSQSAIETINETCASWTLITAARRSVILPHPRLWVEWRVGGRACGAAFNSAQGFEGIAGDGSMIVRREDGHITGNAFNFDLRAARFLRWSPLAVGDLAWMERGLEGLAVGLSALWASPRMIEVEHVQTPPRLAAARAKRRAPPLCDYSVVYLSKVAVAAKADTGTTTGDGTPRRGNRVRGHLRLLRSGRFVPVRPHERGDSDRPMSGTVRVVG